MEIPEYLELSGKSQKQFAKEVGVCHLSIHRYCKGRIPNNKEIVQRIYDKSEGMVSPNDLYGIGKPAEPRPPVLS